jgi:hypothetical protein
MDEKCFMHRQDEVLTDCVDHLACYRILYKAYVDLQCESEFWTRTIDAHLLRAIIQWCMIFGADSEGLHWKRVVDRCNQDGFRGHLLDVLEFTCDQWATYRQSMVAFRNKYVAHRALASTYPSAPIMDKALLVVITYQEWCRRSVNASFDEPSLRERYDRHIRTWTLPLRHAVGLGPTLVQEWEGQIPPPHSHE